MGEVGENVHVNSKDFNLTLGSSIRLCTINEMAGFILKFTNG